MYYTQNHAQVGTRNIWHYLLDSEVGQVHIVQYEKPGKELETFLFYYDNEKAEKKFKSLVKRMVEGKI